MFVPLALMPPSIFSLQFTLYKHAIEKALKIVLWSINVVFCLGSYHDIGNELDCQQPLVTEG